MPSKKDLQEYNHAGALVPRVSQELRRLGLLTMGQVERSYGLVVITMSPGEAEKFADRLAQLIPSEEG